MKKIVSFIILVLILSGCATSVPFEVKVDSINRKKLSNIAKYMIVPGNDGAKMNDLQFLEYVAYVKRALMLNKFSLVKDASDAEVLIFLSYGIGDPEKHQYAYSTPIYGQTGVSSSTTTASVQSFGNMATGISNTTYTPSYGVVGSKMKSGTYVTYTRFLELKAFDAKELKDGGDVVEIWSTKVVSTGSSDDLRRVFPVMVAAAKPYISKNTNRKITININEGDDAVWEIKGNEFLKPAVSKDKVGYYEVDYKEEIKGVGIICRANIESGSLILTLGLKNNTSESIGFDMDSLSVDYEGSDLYRLDKTEAESWLLERGTKEGAKKAINNIKNNYLESYIIAPKEHYLGYIYLYEPTDILNGDKVKVKFSLKNTNIEIPFEYQGGWMTFKVFKEKYDLR